MKTYELFVADFTFFMKAESIQEVKDCEIEVSVYNPRPMPRGEQKSITRTVEGIAFKAIKL